MAGVIYLTDEDFDREVLQSDRPVMVDFWAEWCMPCKMIAPAVEAIAQENAATLKVGKVNVDESPGVASKYGIRSIPTLLFFKDGKVVEKAVGAISKETIQQFVDKLK